MEKRPKFLNAPPSGMLKISLQSWLSPISNDSNTSHFISWHTCILFYQQISRQSNLSFKVELYYMILERLEKYKEALDVVRGKLGGNLLCQLITTVVWRNSSSPLLQTCPLVKKKKKGCKKPDSQHQFQTLMQTLEMLSCKLVLPSCSWYLSVTQ